MVIALEVSRADKSRVAARVSPLAELLACLHVLAEPDHHPESRAWVEKVRAQLPESLTSDLQRFSPLWARYRTRLFFPLELAPEMAIDDELAALLALNFDTFLPLAANGIAGNNRSEVAGGQVLLDRAWIAYCEQRSFSRGDLAYSLASNPGKFRADLVATLRASCDAFFSAEWELSSSLLRSTADALSDKLRSEPLIPVIESLSKIASSRGTSTTVFFDKLQSDTKAVDEHGLVLVPSLRGWPHTIIKSDEGLPVVIHFLAHEARTGGKAQSQQDVRQRLLVLAEPGRWELCRHLIGESITTSELSRRTGLTTPAVSRHLRVLREAGLISSQRDGRQVFHRVHTSLIVHLGQDVLNAIIR